MTRDEVIRLAREVWGETAILPFESLQLFAELVAKHEREECAKVCETLNPDHQECNYYDRYMANAIRNRSTT